MKTSRQARPAGSAAADATAGDAITELADAAAAPRKSAATRGRILDAAAKMFSLHGYAGARLADIAREADTQAGSLYYHFASREALVEEVLDVGIDRVTLYVADQVGRLPPEASFREKLATAIEAHLITALQNDYYTSGSLRIFAQVPEAIRARHILRQRTYGNFWRGLLEAARDAGEIRPDMDLSTLRMLLLGSINWSVEWYRPGRLSVPEIAAQLATLLFEGAGGVSAAAASGRKRA